MKLKQNKRGGALMWIIIVIVILALGYFLLGGSETPTTTDVEDTGVNLEDAEDSAFENVETTDQILNEIDDSLNYIE
jgi:hypothetical protein